MKALWMRVAPEQLNVKLLCDRRGAIIIHDGYLTAKINHAEFRPPRVHPKLWDTKLDALWVALRPQVAQPRAPRAPQQAHTQAPTSRTPSAAPAPMSQAAAPARPQNPSPGPARPHTAQRGRSPVYRSTSRPASPAQNSQSPGPARPATAPLQDAGMPGPQPPRATNSSPRAPASAGDANAADGSAYWYNVKIGLLRKRR